MDWKNVVAALIALFAAYFIFKVVYKLAEDMGL